LNLQKVGQDLDDLRSRIEYLEAKMQEMRDILSTLLGDSTIVQVDKDAMLTTLESKSTKEPEGVVKRKVYDKTIQELLDESQGKGR